jgi:hypothetical protein
MRRLLAVAVVLAVAVLPMGAAATADDLAVQTALPDSGKAVPLAAPTPDWYTAELHAQVLAAGVEGVPLPEGVELPESALLFTGIRPGSWMIAPAWCTMNFVFAGGGNGRGNGRGNGGNGSGLAIGTAGHCTDVRDEVVLVMAPGVLVYIGDTTKSVDGGVGNDFALVAIRSEVADLVNPSMAIVAGPTGTGDPQHGDAMTHVGHGVVIGTGGTPRAGVVGHRDGDVYGWAGAALFGDSGSPVRDVLGEASGNLTHLVAGTTAERMEQVAGMRIATASLVPDPLP